MSNPLKGIKRCCQEGSQSLKNRFSNGDNKDDSQQKSEKNGQYQNYIVFLALNAERTGHIIQDLRDRKKLTQEAVSVLSRMANIEALWQGTEEDYNYIHYQINQCFKSPSQQKDNYDVYLLQIKLNQPEPELYNDMPSTSRSRAFRRLLKKEHSVEVSQRLPRESIGNNPHLYR